jgi:hypothetical protein
MSFNIMKFIDNKTTAHILLNEGKVKSSHDLEENKYASLRILFNTLLRVVGRAVSQDKERASKLENRKSNRQYLQMAHLIYKKLYHTVRIDT